MNYKAIPADLADALKDFSEIVEMAEEDGFPDPSPLAFANARYLLMRMFFIFQVYYSVYPSPDGEIAIHYVSKDKKHALLVLCDSQGGVAVFLSSDEYGNERITYDKADSLPDVFLCRMLNQVRG